MVRDSENKISTSIANYKIADRFARLLKNRDYSLESVPIEELSIRACTGETFCVATDCETLDSLEDKNRFFEDIRRQNVNVGIILFVDENRSDLCHKLIGTENLLIVNNDSDNGVFEYSIMSFFAGLRKIVLNSSVSELISSEVKIFSIPNDLRLVRPVTEHLIRDLISMGIAGPEEVFNIKFGVQEMLINAIEHGNLGITYEEKSELLNCGADIGKFLLERSADPKYNKKRVTVKYTLTRDFVRYVIRDEGNGFNHRNIPTELTAESFLSVHGRGIMMSRGAFDEFFYNEEGNEITMVIYRK